MSNLADAQKIARLAKAFVELPEIIKEADAAGKRTLFLKNQIEEQEAGLREVAEKAHRARADHKKRIEDLEEQFQSRQKALAAETKEAVTNSRKKIKEERDKHSELVELHQRQLDAVKSEISQARKDLSGLSADKARISREISEMKAAIAGV